MIPKKLLSHFHERILDWARSSRNNVVLSYWKIDLSRFAMKIIQIPGKARQKNQDRFIFRPRKEVGAFYLKK